MTDYELHLLRSFGNMSEKQRASLFPGSSKAISVAASGSSLCRTYIDVKVLKNTLSRKMLMVPERQLYHRHSV